MPRTYNDLYLDIRRVLVKENVLQPSLEAREIVCYAAGKSKEDFFKSARVYVPEYVERESGALLERRLLGEPLAYVIGEWEFMGHTFDIDENVLVPRPDTELLCETAIEAAKGFGEPRILDLCTGSGCVGVSIALAVKDSKLILGDISGKALSVARGNIRRHTLSTQAACVVVDALRPASISIGQFDMIVANPPYIPSGDIFGLDISVKNFEPVIALDGGEDGLDFFISIAKGFKHVLKKGGCLIFECGIGQAERIVQLLDKNGYSEITVHNDMSGIERVIKCILV
ncbi:MAG: peptide chain release factor N(5)-glutamine methyltransferase [Oscillospiraceae bacterium]|jgi:release factor glutamine methyltransferase|nr:peptide chain release factor N(5)-glutamine methyltransferase [Oscillospiraceae bacterium]